MFKAISRPVATALALTIGLTGAASAGPLNIWSASRQQTEVSTPSVQDVQYRRYHRHRHHRHNGISPGAAAAIGIGALATGAIIASQRDRYYEDDYYYDEGPSYYEGRSSYCDNSNRPKHYPAPAGC